MEIKRNNWSRFCKRFNASNQYRRTTLRVADKASSERNAISTAPFMGVAITKNGRFIDGVQFLTGRPTPDCITAPAVEIKDPASIIVEKDDTGNDCCLIVRSKDGTEARLDILGDRDETMSHNLIERLAYSMFESRGRNYGNDWGDWYAAEKRIRHAEMQLTK